MKPMKMKRYPSFAAFQADQAAGAQAVLRALRRFAKRTAPALTESVKWGNGCWLLDGAPVCYAHVEPDHVQFGFFSGARLDDPLRLLHGAGKHVRHVKLRSAKDLDARAFAALLAQALQERAG